MEVIIGLIILGFFGAIVLGAIRAVIGAGFLAWGYIRWKDIPAIDAGDKIDSARSALKDHLKARKQFWEFIERAKSFHGYARETALKPIDPVIKEHEKHLKSAQERLDEAKRAIAQYESDGIQRVVRKEIGKEL
jgi:hypothetical protein